MLNEEAGNPPFSAGQRALRELKNRPEPGGRGRRKTIGEAFSEILQRKSAAAFLRKGDWCDKIIHNDLCGDTVLKKEFPQWKIPFSRYSLERKFERLWNISFLNG